MFVGDVFVCQPSLLTSLLHLQTSNSDLRWIEGNLAAGQRRMKPGGLHGYSAVFIQSTRKKRAIRNTGQNLTNREGQSVLERKLKVCECLLSGCNSSCDSAPACISHCSLCNLFSLCNHISCLTAVFANLSLIL